MIGETMKGRSGHEFGGARERWPGFGVIYASIDTQCAWLPAQSNSFEL